MADDRRATEGRGLSPALIAGIVIALAAIDFIVQNRDDTAIHFLFFETEKPLWVLLLITSVLAIAAAQLIGTAIRRSRRD
jgi:uncharacterized integral membrane protein